MSGVIGICLTAKMHLNDRYWLCVIRSKSLDLNVFALPVVVCNISVPKKKPVY